MGLISYQYFFIILATFGGYMVYACNNAVWSAIENCLVPPLPTTSWYYSTVLKNSVIAVCLLPVGIITGTFAGFHKACSYAAHYFSSKIDPKEHFQAVVDDATLWSQIGTDAIIEEELTNNPNKMIEPEIEGVGTSTFQDSPLFCPDSQWGPKGWQQQIPEADRPGFNSKLFELYQTSGGRREVISQLKKLNITTYRFSIEWSHLEPSQGTWNQENMNTYIQMCKDLRDAGIDPTITLLHFSEPIWFHEMGSFEKEENIQHFESFASSVFDQLTQDYNGKPLVERFFTINEPAIDAFSRYLLGTFGPGIKMNFTKAGTFLKNALKAHCAVYEILKKKDFPTVKVGIIHQYLRMRPTNFLLIPACRYFTRFLNDVPMNFFRSGGKFDLKVPFLCNIEEQCTKEGSPPTTDIVGTQCYARPWIGVTGPTSCGEPMTMMPFQEDPAVVYEAIKETHEAFKAPVLVTEIGISTNDNEQRKRFMLRSRYAIRQAVKDVGPNNVLGMIWWCLGDNMELERGMNQCFGQFALTDRGLEAEPKQGTLASIRVAKAWRERQQEKV
jgi:beta-glucosidase